MFRPEGTRHRRSWLGGRTGVWDSMGLQPPRALGGRRELPVTNLVSCSFCRESCSQAFQLVLCTLLVPQFMVRLGSEHCFFVGKLGRMALAAEASITSMGPSPLQAPLLISHLESHPPWKKRKKKKTLFCCAS